MQIAVYKKTAYCIPYTIYDAYLLYNSRKPNKEIFASDVTRPWEYREKQLQGLIKFLDTEKEAIFKGLWYIKRQDPIILAWYNNRLQNLSDLSKYVYRTRN